MVGGGPAGAAAAITLRRAGCEVVVLHPTPPPSFRVGESVPPEMRVVLDQLGVVFDLRGEGHLTSRGNAGREAAEALLSTSSWSPASSSRSLSPPSEDGLVAYDDHIRRRFTAYLEDRRLFYRREARWDSEFWARRRGRRHQPR